MPHYRSCLSVCPSVRYIYGLVTRKQKKAQKNQNWSERLKNVSQTRSNRGVNFQFKRPKVRVAGKVGVAEEL